MNAKLNPRLLDVVSLPDDGTRLPLAHTGTVVEILNTPRNAVLIEIADEEGIPTDLIVSEIGEIAWRKPEPISERATPSRAEELFESGLLLLQNGLIPKAKAAFADAFKMDLRFAGTLMNLANESATRSALEAAIFLYQMILELQPDYRLALENLAIAHLNQGVALARGGVIDNAIQEFNEALLLHPSENTQDLCKRNLIAAFTSLGVRLDSIKRYQEGVQFFLIAFQLDPSKVVTQKNLALALVAAAASEHKGRAIPSREGLKKFLLMGLSLSECLNAFGATLAALGRTSEAENALYKAIEADPRNELAQKNLKILQSQEVPLDLPLGIREFELPHTDVPTLQPSQ